MYQVAIHFDILKIFHTVRTKEPEKFMRLMVWKNGNNQKTWQSYGWKVVAFGDCPSSCILEIAKDLTAHAGGDIDEVAAKCISKDTYVDNGATGRDKETAQRLIGDVFINKDGLLTELALSLKYWKKEASV